MIEIGDLIYAIDPVLYPHTVIKLQIPQPLKYIILRIILGLYQSFLERSL